MANNLPLYRNFNKLPKDKKEKIIKGYFQEKDNKILRLYVKDKNGYKLKNFYLLKAKSSWQLTTWILKYSDLKPTARLVSAHLSVFYNLDRGTCHPTFDTLQRVTGLSRATVNKAVREIEQSREWIVIKPGSHRANQYIPNVPNFLNTQYTHLPDELIFKNPNGKSDRLAEEEYESDASNEGEDTEEDYYIGLEASYEESIEE